MTGSFAQGLYELLVTQLVDEQLRNQQVPGAAELDDLRSAEIADRIALHVAQVVETALESTPEDKRGEMGVELARTLIAQIAALVGVSDLTSFEPTNPARVLRAIRRRLPDGAFEPMPRPLIPLLDTTLLTNAPGEPRVGHQIEAEIASADRIDVVMAFIRLTGINPLKESLRRHVQDGKPLRVLTTTFTGTTEEAAIEALLQMGGQVRVSYDTTSTRLHAKAWVFHRESGYSTAYVGSSNLTRTAQVTGLEWNVRISAARNRAVIEKVSAVFESYWNQADFEDYDRERFTSARRSGPSGTVLTLSPIEVRLEPFQERLLEQIEVSRQQGFHRNLLVSATGTGKTVMAAVDYARLRAKLPRARLLFVAHREEILEKSLSTFRHALRQGDFGELWVGSNRPVVFESVFASIQSLAASGIENIDPSRFDVVVVDEFHHAAAATYERLLARLKPVEMLGLTATPERSDGLPLLHWFGHRIAAELRLWDAIDQHRLAPFSYFGIADELDLQNIPWRRGTGYDVDQLTNLITSSDVWARAVVRQYFEKLGSGEDVRALGFCVSVKHARYMARVFQESGISTVAVSAETDDDARKQALADLTAGRINVVFSVDLFNEGIDVPAVNALLMLRPTESALLFLQQLGRGLRKAPGKDICTVLDFVGQHRREFRYDRRFQALIGGSRAHLRQHIEQGFPFLPSGCSMQLDRVAATRVLASIKNAVPSTWTEKANELRILARERPHITLDEFIVESGLELEDVYHNGRSWSDLRAAAGLQEQAVSDAERHIRRAIGRLLHIDDPARLTTWRDWSCSSSPPDAAALSQRDRRLLRMLLVQLLDPRDMQLSLQQGAAKLWQHETALAELVELFDCLGKRIDHVATPLAEIDGVPLAVHGRYTRLEILAAASDEDRVGVRPWREGTLYDQSLRADFFAFTLDKTSGQFSPTTRYRDYAISRELVHWESQSTTAATSNTGMRYQNHAAQGSHVLLFARLRADDRAFVLLGPGTYVRHVGERPMAITWRLKYPIPGDLFQQFAAAVA